MDNQLIELVSQGLSWGDSIAAEAQARLLNEGKAEAWREEIKTSAESVGIPRTLRRISLSFKSTNAWGIYQKEVLTLLGLSELYGLSYDPSELVKKVAHTDPKSWEEAEQSAKTLAREYLEKQIEAGDVYLLRPSDITSPDFSVYVPQIIERRRHGIEGARPYVTEDDLVDMFDFLELPIAMDLMIKSGIGGRTTSTEAKRVLKELSNLGLTSAIDLSTKRPKEYRASVEDQYLRLFAACIPYQRDLLRGSAMALDPDPEICRKGLEMIHRSGHEHCEEPLLRALKRDDEEIITLSLQGLGILGKEEAIPEISTYLGHSNNEIRRETCNALGQLKASDYIQELDQMLRVNDEKLQLAAMRALLQINTPSTQETFWNNFQRFGMIKLAALSKDIADTGSVNAIHFLVNLLLLDIQSFVESREIQVFNAFIGSKTGAENQMAKIMLSMLRDQAKWGFGRLGAAAVPVLVSLLKIFPETSGLITSAEGWTPSEQEINERMQWRIQQHLRFPRPEHLPMPFKEAILALGMTHSERAIPYLKELSLSSNEEIVLLAIEALGEIDTPALDALIAVPAITPAVRRRKLTEIGTISHPTATAWLIEQGKDNDDLVRIEATNFLAMRNDPSLTEHLMSVAKDPNVLMRVGLANVITRLGMDAYPDIMKVLNEDPDDAVRNTIVRARLHLQADEQNDFWA